VRDPHHLPRWWPRVMRVEDVTLTGTGEADAFTEVMKTRKGKLVRADFNVIVGSEGERTLTWVQRLEGTPFAQWATTTPSNASSSATRGVRGGE